jgi:hypothetical protein
MRWEKTAARWEGFSGLAAEELTAPGATLEAMLAGLRQVREAL